MPAGAQAATPATASPAASASGGWGGLLANAAATAAGVAGGAGLEGLFAHHGAGFSGAGAGGETIVNLTANNYASDAGSQGDVIADDSRADQDDSTFDDDSSWT